MSPKPSRHQAGWRCCDRGPSLPQRTRADTPGWRHCRGPPQKRQNKYFTGHQVGVTSLNLRLLKVRHSSLTKRFLTVSGDNERFWRWFSSCLSFLLGRDGRSWKAPLAPLPPERFSVTTWGQSTVKLLYSQMHLLQGIPFIYINVCIFS